jgi:Cu-Zn family superoxide dismutase
MNRSQRTCLALILTLLGGLIALPSVAFGQTSDQARRYTLPGATVFPEGVAYDAASGYFYATSNTDGTVFRGSLNADTAEVFLPGGQDGRTAGTGLKVDAQGRLFVCGAATGKMFVYDTRSKQLLGAFDSGAAPNTFINDVVVTPNGDAYFTDSRNPILYRVSTNAQGQLAFENWLNFTGTALTYKEGFNINGITASADGRYLIVVQTNTGMLYRITVATKEVQPIDVGAETFTFGDGILLTGNVLHIARNQLALIVSVQLSADYLTGTVVSAMTDPSFAYPTTIALAGNRLLVANSQFNKRGPNLTPELPFTIASVPAPLATLPGMPTTGAGDPLPLVLLMVAGVLLVLGGGLRRVQRVRSH